MSPAGNGTAPAGTGADRATSKVFENHSQDSTPLSLADRFDDFVTSELHGPLPGVPVPVAIRLVERWLDVPHGSQEAEDACWSLWDSKTVCEMAGPDGNLYLVPLRFAEAFGTEVARGGSDEDDPDAPFPHTVSADDVDTLPARESLIEGVLARDTLAFLYGEPASYKSFAALGMAYSVAAGVPWQGREVQPGRVLYIAAEGRSGLGQRARALREHLQLGALGEALTFRTTRVNLLDADEVGLLVAKVRRTPHALIVIDTLARSMPGGDENGVGMGLALDAADRLRHASGACVLLVHHPGRSRDGLRGHSSAEGNADTIIRAKRSGDVVTLMGRKDKEGEDMAPLCLRFLPVDGSGSGVLVPADVSAAEAPPEGAAGRIQAVLAERGPLNGADLATACAGKRQEHFRVRRELEAAGTIRKEGSHWLLSEGTHLGNQFPIVVPRGSQLLVRTHFSRSTRFPTQGTSWEPEAVVPIPTHL